MTAVTRPALTAAAALLALAGAAACNTGFAPQYRVEDLRILAVRTHVQGSAAADLRPGDTLVLEALVANPTGRAGLAVDWYGCLPAASERLAACEDASLLADPARLASAPGVLSLGSGGPPAADPAPPSFVTSIAVSVAATPELLEGTRFVADRARSDPNYRCKLWAELPVVAVARADGRELVAVKRVRVWPTDAQLSAAGFTPAQELENLNLNPAITGVVRAPADRDACTGGAAVDAGPFPAGETVVCGASDAGQRFDVCRPGEPVTEDAEEMSWQWYVTAGEFPEFDGIGNADERDVDFVRPGGAFMLWAIVRDERGGVAWEGFPIGPAP